MSFYELRWAPMGSDVFIDYTAMLIVTYSNPFDCAFFLGILSKLSMLGLIPSLPIIPILPIFPRNKAPKGATFYNLRAKRTLLLRQNFVMPRLNKYRAKRSILLRQNFVMPRLCYGSAEQVNLLCSRLNRKVQFSVFIFQFINMRRRHPHITNS